MNIYYKCNYKSENNTFTVGFLHVRSKIKLCSLKSFSGSGTWLDWDLSHSLEWKHDDVPGLKRNLFFPVDSGGSLNLQRIRGRSSRGDTQDWHWKKVNVNLTEPWIRVFIKEHLKAIIEAKCHCSAILFYVHKFSAGSFIYCNLISLE